MKVYEVPLTFAEHIDMLGPDIRSAFTGPLVLWFLESIGFIITDSQNKVLYMVFYSR